MSSRSLILLALLAVSTSHAFTPPSRKSSSSSATAVFATSRRDLLSSAMTGAASLLFIQPASATYTAYTQREQDWEERKKTGAVKFSNAKSLRAQLKEIVPQNSEGSKIFCPNGMSSAVSPLQENKCGDQLAMPSVYGRTEDVVGNSIPGFGGGGKYSGITSSQQLSASDVGGFPKYK
jgi:hypothetical protein